ncbi:lipopolysaccharide biosynthesis protein [Butyrivibrio sp. M55]|uniref:lipopolysaccharide biosynthesis protein n=1 Tax=Butyrivibrio sp. M55 TaxID=1855323 RepID=UPI0008E3B3A6|nr:polysaccharide biosynthesis protein [Butyrivibrio sp. M55]SFU66644.1 Membrane protein involved in the export of O-antigen and teichoic acid [Butyrivibrio sp. M55]
MGRVQAAKKNILFGYIGQVVSIIMTYVLRTFFILKIGKELLGVNSLYANVLQLLNMADMGIGTALNFSLYGPVARGEKEKIKSYMQFYKKAYNYIAAAVCVIGLLLVPFLKRLVNLPEDFVITERELVLYYLIFLFNTVSSYFVAYKYSLVNAEQKNYIQTNVITFTKIITVCFQLIVVLTTGNFYLYLITDAVVQLIQKIFVSKYLDNMYPYLKEKNIEKLSKDEEGEVWTKTKALVFHRVGDAFRLQTDQLIISPLLGTVMSAVVDNYNQIIVQISNFVNIIFNSVISSFGNLIATEDKSRQYSMFKVYRFFASWVYGFSATGFMLLISPLVNIWLIKTGNATPENIGEWMLPGVAVFLILTDYYFKGERTVLTNYKTAAGVFEQDKYLALIQGIVNLILSIWLVQTPLGISGIYVGTVVSGLIANMTKPVIIYRACFGMSAVNYYIDSFKYLASMALVMGICYMIQQLVMPEPTILGFAAMVVIITVVFNGVYFLLYGRSEEFRYLCGKLKARKA